MRISELSARSAVAVPTIKFYLREGLLPPGTATAANQAAYGELHVRRLRLIRALIDVGGVPVASARAVVEELDRDDLAPHDLLGVAHEAVAPKRHPDRGTEAWRLARDRAASYVAGLGWRVNPTAIGLDLLADALAALEELELTEVLASIDRYAAAADEVARFEVDAVIARREPARMLELVVLGTILGETLLGALRLLAHEHNSALRLTEERP
jgi:DNA-binding transcriptional MerR regulator